LLDLVLIPGPEYQQHVIASLKRPAEPRYAFRLQVIHEDSVRFPLGLRFERLFAIVGWSVPADDHEEGVCA
jgi:hypothetical protein